MDAPVIPNFIPILCILISSDLLRTGSNVFEVTAVIEMAPDK